LQQEFGLPLREVPLLAIIGRLTQQKGFDLVLESLPELMNLDVQIALLGSGDRHLEEQFLTAKSRYPNRIGISLGFDEGLAHRIEAGADMLLMPSRYEPCGLSQLYSLRYGTIPIVRRTGGLADTVVPFRPSTVQARLATGFHFVDASSDTLLSTTLLALQIYKDRGTWESLRQTGMKVDVSWVKPTEHYAHLYRSVMGVGTGANAQEA
jgi:starch synthase